MNISVFDEALRSFRTFLGSNGCPENVVWVFRDDLRTESGKGLVKFPVLQVNGQLARKVFDEGRTKGLVQITAVGVTDHFTAANIWFPRTAEEEVQGWSQGMKLSIVRPLPSLRVVRGAVAWWLVRLTPSYLSYQREHTFIPTREWASV